MFGRKMLQILLLDLSAVEDTPLSNLPVMSEMTPF